jgi:hypothetical protein
MTQNKVNALDLKRFIRSELGIATGNNDERMRMYLPDAPDQLPAFLIGQFRYGTRIDDTNTGRFPNPCFSNAVRSQFFSDRRRFGKIQLTA